MCLWVGHMPPPVGGSSGGCPAVWGISHHRGYCSRKSTVRPPHPCGSSCGAPLLGRRPPPALCAGTPVINCFHGSGRRLLWSPMQRGRIGPAALEYRSCHWPGGSARSPQCVGPWGCRPWCPVPLLPLVHVRVRCPGPRGACSPVCALCAVRVCCWWWCPSSSPPNFLFCFFCSVFVLFCRAFFFFRKMEKGARAHCRHRHGQLVQRCNSVVSSGVCRRCFGGGRAPGVRLARPDVHGYGSGWVRLVASLLLRFEV